MHKSSITKDFALVFRTSARKLRGHPYFVVTASFLAAFCVASVLFVAIGGQTIGAPDSHVVKLSVDGLQQKVPTRAVTVGELLDRLQIKMEPSDLVVPAPASAITDDNFAVSVQHAKPVTIIDQGHRITALAPEAPPRQSAEAVGVKIYPEDNVTVAPSDDLLRDGIIGQKIIVDRATPTTINLYGNPIAFRTHAKTVAEALKQKNIQTLPDDTVQPSPATPLTAGTQIFVVHYGKQVVTTEEEIPAQQQTVDDPALASGQTVVRTAGAPGKKLVTYEVSLTNNHETGRQKLQEVVTAEPVARIIARGSLVVITNPSDNVKLGQQMAAGRGWTGEQWYCLYQLWQKESSWRTNAGNPSGAYGIPQALPGSKMAASGADWRTNPATQITWGFGYIARGYGTPCGAWHHSQSFGWY